MINPGLKNKVRLLGVILGYFISSETWISRKLLLVSSVDIARCWKNTISSDQIIQLYGTIVQEDHRLLKKVKWCAYLLTWLKNMTYNLSWKSHFPSSFRIVFFLGEGMPHRIFRMLLKVKIDLVVTILADRPWLLSIMNFFDHICHYYIWNLAVWGSL